MLVSRAVLAPVAGSSVKVMRRLVLEGQSRLPHLVASRDTDINGSTARPITPEQFREEHLTPKKPGHFPALVKDQQSPYRWPACDEWPGRGADQDALAGLASTPELQRQTVDVEVAAWGRGYGDGVRQNRATHLDDQEQAESSEDEAAAVQAWTQLRLALPLFFDAFVHGKVPQQGSLPLVGYLAQQDLFDVSPTLQRQCPPLPHALAGARGAREQWRRNLWIGGAGTFTPIHCDPYENLFVQVVGRKRIHVFPPTAREHLCLFDASSMQPNTSEVPTEAPLLEDASEKDSPEELADSRFPDLERAIAQDGAAHVVMEAGDALYIPQGWFHCVSSLSVSASVNAWFR